jgi:hypothetical protein
MNLTGYYVLDGRIHGPRRDGEFWIENGHIFSAEDPAGRYVVHADGHISGPNGHTAFRLDRSSGQILGPHPLLPWLLAAGGAIEDSAERDDGADALGG